MKFFYKLVSILIRIPKTFKQEEKNITSIGMIVFKPQTKIYNVKIECCDSITLAYEDHQQH